MNKTLKTVLIIFLALVIIGLAIGGYFIWRHCTTYIGKRAAEDIAVADSGVAVTEIKDVDADFKHNRYSAWYEVDVETFDVDYEYIIDARTGEILNTASETAHADKTDRDHD